MPPSNEAQPTTSSLPSHAGILTVPEPTRNVSLSDPPRRVLLQPPPLILLAFDIPFP